MKKKILIAVLSILVLAFVVAMAVAKRIKLVQIL